MSRSKKSPLRGALGYVSKSAPVEELLAAVAKAARGTVDDQTSHDLADVHAGGAR